ncbi:hypothetical protein ACIQZM_09060 [Peribacillus sp. NPDC097206]|uniref:hypothetical protein n=1 Tax=Peribacillus sp. NPDC097206 TaxID=3364398 RepID=UPI003818C7D1
MCILELYQFMVIFLMTSKTECDLGGLLLLEKKDVNIRGRIIYLGHEAIQIDDTTAYAFLILINKMEHQQKRLFIKDSSRTI